MIARVLRRVESRQRQLRGAIIVLAVAALSLAASCGDGGDGDKVDPGPLKTYVAPIEGTDAQLALITDGNRVAGYVADGKSVSTWFATDELDDGKATLATRDGFELGEVEISDDSASGEISLAHQLLSFDENIPFEADLAEGKAGLYVAAEKEGADSFEAGWVVLPDGSEVGNVDTFIDGEFKTEEAPKLKAAVNIPPFGPQSPREHASIYLEVNAEAPN